MASTSTPGSASEKLQKLQHMNSTLSNINKILETLLGGEIEGINEREQILLRTDLAVYVMRAKNVLDEAKNMRLIVAIPPLLCSLLVECDDASYKPDLARAEIRKLRIEAGQS
ncbi:hypothetical protein EVJ58_g2531 [Rhodofomes roseus]|uniref:Uncharacterized protein n=1 Tax=Rhodofomes roseus TaxID=34475 RepID=A0A4Y9YQ83_9APHY|nr:hypothetical protein EVJ58_g2531 [Rhodofomes roseus]